MPVSTSPPQDKVVSVDVQTYDRLVRERINDSSIADFDLLTVVSQGALNDQLRAICLSKSVKLLSKLDFPAHLIDVDTKQRYDARFEAQLGAPSIILHTQPDQEQNATYIMNIQSGAFTWSVKDKTGVLRTLRTVLSNAAVEFQVRLRLDQQQFEADHYLAEMSDHALKASGISAETHVDKVQQMKQQLNDYSFQRLLLDFNTASKLQVQNVSEPGSTKTCLDDGGKAGQPFEAPLTLDIRQAICEAVQQHVTELAGGDAAVLQYSKLLKEASGSTLNPTSIDFVCLPWRVDSASAPVEGLKAGSHNALAFVQNTNHRALTNAAALGKALKPNFLLPPHPQTGYAFDGAVVLAKRAFLEGWFLNRMQQFNRIFSIDQIFPEKDDKPTDYSWKPAGEHDLEQMRPGFISADLYKQCWRQQGLTSNRYLVYNHVNDGHFEASLPGTDTLKVSFRTSNDMFVPTDVDEQGSQQIVVKGSTWFKISSVGAIGGALQSLFGSSALIPSAFRSASWQFSLRFQGLSDKNELDIAVEPKPTEMNGAKTIPMNIGDLQTEAGGLDAMNETTRDWFGDFIKDAFDGVPLHTLLHDLDQELSSDNFIMAQGQSYKVQKATFNKSGDLMCELKLKG